MKKSGLIAVSLIFALPLLAVFGGCGEDSSTCTCDQEELEAQIAELRAELDSVILLNQYLTISSASVNGLAGPQVIFEGVNVHIRNGDAATNTTNGLGNLVVGYNEEPSVLNPGDRGGSHNLIVGPQHKYLSYGGFVAGQENTVSGNSASVSGGQNNIASGNRSSVSGGNENEASGLYASVSGGYLNEATYGSTSVSGGYGNVASHYYASVSGGVSNTASGWYASISGGSGNGATTQFASVSGGRDNTASGQYSSVSGGNGVTNSSLDHWIACDIECSP